MSGPVFAAVAAIVLFALAGGYVWGWLNGSERAEHAPQTCRDKLKATERAAAMWRGRAVQLEDENKELRLDQAEHERAETVTVQLLLAELDQAAAAVRTADDLGATALRALGALPALQTAPEPLRDLKGAPAI